jgi:FlaA1/EpsC-like NDP-sugar epimerase/lipopolysaccharide/colanic/teichoic acid biosynthesis glycosyltransferase
MANMIKRFIDIVLAIIGIALTLPFLPIVALLIKLDSKGPVFYLCDRVGKGMRLFKMYKFRTMLDTPIQVGESVSPKYDPRVSSLGRFLRRTKINEVPQFLNILKGDMSFVGPRPEAPDLAKHYPEEARQIFSVKPGLVGPNQIAAFNEEELYPPGVNEKDYYFSHILPWKTTADLEYINNPSLLKDFRFIFVAVWKTLTGLVNRTHLCQDGAQFCLVLADITLVIACTAVVEGLDLGRLWSASELVKFLAYLPLVIALRVSCFCLFGLYSSLIEHMSLRDIVNIMNAVVTGSLLLMLAHFTHGLPPDTMLIALDSGMLIALLSAVRFGLKLHRGKSRVREAETKTHRVLIFAAGHTGALAHRALSLLERSPYQVVGFVDDAPEKYGKRLHGLKVLGNRHNIAALARLHDVHEIIIATSTVAGEDVSNIIEICREAGLPYRVFSPVRDAASGDRFSFPVRTLGISDILPLRTISMDRQAVQRRIQDQTIMLYGSGGSLGVELCRRILQLGCARLIIVDRYESYLTELSASLCNLCPKEKIVPLLIASENIHALEEVFAKYRPNTVFHMTMKKYLPFVEVNKDEIVTANWKNTFLLAKFAVEYGIDCFFAISSFAANNENNFLSASLRIAELALQQLFGDTNTRLVIGRICDVAENRGGIVSLIKNQIKKQSTITLPSPDAKTHLLSKDSAAEFILQALVEGSAAPHRNGVFVCDPGPPVALVEVAKRLAELYGLKAGTDLPITYLDRTPYESSRLPATLQKMEGTGHQGIKFLEENRSAASHALMAALKNFPQDLNLLLYAAHYGLQIEDLVDRFRHPLREGSVASTKSTRRERSPSSFPRLVSSPQT